MILETCFIFMVNLHEIPTTYLVADLKITRLGNIGYSSVTQLIECLTEVENYMFQKNYTNHTLILVDSPHDMLS